jgi:hypothetical protein
MTSPSYPQRVHVRDRGRLKELVRTWEQNLAKYGQELAANPDDAHRRRLYAQMLGARDQLADAARRMPMEVGDLYEEDHHRLETAVEAFERLARQWVERPRS